MSAIGYLKSLYYSLAGTELPCGCIARDGRGVEYSNDTTVVDREIETLHSTDYTNCTKYENRWRMTIECDHCGAEWTKTKRAGSKVDYGDENPEAHARLETDYSSPFVKHREKPVVSKIEQ